MILYPICSDRDIKLFSFLYYTWIMSCITFLTRNSGSTAGNPSSTFFKNHLWFKHLIHCNLRSCINHEGVEVIFVMYMDCMACFYTWNKNLSLYVQSFQFLGTTNRIKIRNLNTNIKWWKRITRQNHEKIPRFLVIFWI